MNLKKIFNKLSWHSCEDGYVKWFISNPLGTWYKARKYFKLPTIKINVFTNLRDNCPYASFNNVGKILNISCCDVSWKDKWNSPRHERNPYIWVCFFKRFGFSIHFRVYYIDELGNKTSGDMYYWEYLLDYLYYSKSLRISSTWTYTSKLYRRTKWGKAEDGSNDKYVPLERVIPTPNFSLTKKGFKELQKLYGKHMY